MSTQQFTSNREYMNNLEFKKYFCLCTIDLVVHNHLQIGTQPIILF